MASQLEPVVVGLVLVSSGMDGGKLSAVVEGLKASSKNCGAHKKRQLYWAAYGAIASKLGGVDGSVDGIFSYTLEGESLEFVEFTKRQKHALASGSMELMGKKIRPIEEPDSKAWCIIYDEDDSEIALADIRSAEQCVYITQAAIFVGTRLKRRQCKTLSSPVKTLKDLEKVLSEIGPCLQSVNWNDQLAPTVNGYNLLLAGCAPALELPPTVGRSDSAAPADVYEAFTARRSAHFVTEAERLLDQMLADNGRQLKPLICAASMKEAGLAKRNSLMKKVYVHESKAKFVDTVRADGDVEMHVVTGDISGTRFDDFGGVVFELFYRVDLSIFS